MANTKISAFTDGATANATDRIAAARSPFGATDNRYLTPVYLQTYLDAQAHTLSVAGAASTPAGYFTGAILTGGTGTTNFPHIFVQPTGATASTTWSTAGTVFGANVATGFAGNLLDLQKGSSLFAVSAVAGTASLGQVRIGGGGTNVAQMTFLPDSGNSVSLGMAGGGSALIVFASGVQNLGMSNGNYVVLNSGSFAWSSTSNNVLSSQDVVLSRDATGTLALRNSTNAQNFNVYNTYTNSTNYERLEIGYTSNVAFIKAAKLGTGAARDLKLWGGGDVYIEPNNAAFTGVVRINSANVYLNGNIGLQSNGSGLLGLLDSSGVNFTRIQMGGTTNSFNAIARDGAGTKFVGADGTSVSWTKVPPVAIASLPSAATAGNGARSFVTDALAPTFGSTVSAGGAVSTPVYSDGTNWKVG